MMIVEEKIKNIKKWENDFQRNGYKRDWTCFIMGMSSGNFLFVHLQHKIVSRNLEFFEESESIIGGFVTIFWLLSKMLKICMQHVVFEILIIE